MIVLRVGLVRKRDLFVYGFASPSKPVAVGPGSVALVLRGGLVIVASAMPREFGVRELQINPGDVLVKGKVRRQFCWDNNFIWPPENAESLIALVDSGYALIIERLSEAPNIVRMYRRLVSQGLIRADTVLNIQASVSTTPTLIGIIEVREMGRGKQFWKLPRPCLAGQYVNNALIRLGVRVV
ncbi:hypothetical protein [Vulcanisaeta distributa]|uniref:hypothetical protein n=1 Tax=Vulcanisaeta distributa TaxID=164451 RepID=UPI0006D138E7|nr:hypothetical protein [Vulcanisaeta distributa]